jgi:hypothetical protein
MTVKHAPATAVGALLACLACDSLPAGPPLAKGRGALAPGTFVPARGEQDAIGRVSRKIKRGSADFARLVVNDDPDLIFKDEETTGADRLMTPRLRKSLTLLSRMVEREWPRVRLRVTEAWDEDFEHGTLSAHYEGRAADLTTSDLDPNRLGRLAWLASQAGFDWVYYEDGHVHASVRWE